MKYFFCGIGGIGMSSIARLLVHQGHDVSGSDRSFDLGKDLSVRKDLVDLGIRLFPQDGSGIDKSLDFFITSTAVESTIPDVQKATQLHIPSLRRAALLAQIFNTCTGIAIGGTSGKTTITAMTGHILYEAGKDPTMMNGGISLNTYHGEHPSNLIFGTSDLCVIEADESDGSIELYQPAVAVVSNISLDHKPIDELKVLFADFIKRAKKGAVLNADCPYSKEMKSLNPATKTFSMTQGTVADYVASDIHLQTEGVSFRVNGVPAFLPVIGDHNIANALAAIAATSFVGVSLQEALNALASFKGTKRRLEKVGEAHGISVFDDYAHNPEKVAATLKTLRQKNHRLWVLFQPHGFAPTRLMKNDFIKAFVDESFEQDVMMFPDIFYVGGTVAKDISSQDLAAGVSAQGRTALFLSNREDVLDIVREKAEPGDRIVVMGARDMSLSDLAHQIVTTLQETLS